MREKIIITTLPNTEAYLVTNAPDLQRITKKKERERKNKKRRHRCFSAPRATAKLLKLLFGCLQAVTIPFYGPVNDSHFTILDKISGTRVASRNSAHAEKLRATLGHFFPLLLHFVQVDFPVIVTTDVVVLVFPAVLRGLIPLILLNVLSGTYPVPGLGRAAFVRTQLAVGTLKCVVHVIIGRWFNFLCETKVSRWLLWFTLSYVTYRR